MRDRPFRSPDPGPPEPRKCRACGIPLEFIYGPKGKIIPVQKVKSVYIVGRDLTGRRCLVRQESLAGEEIRISHFEGCPSAGDFSKNKRPKKPPA